MAKNNNTNLAAAGVAGAMIGAAVVAGAAILSDEKTRKKIGGALSDVKDQATDYIDKQKDSPEVKKQAEKAEDKVKEVSAKAEEASEEVKN